MTNNMTIAVDLGKDITNELLIERHGGYEEAKTKFRDNGSFHAERMKAALLAYRRAHNIYEIGDQVVSTLNGDDFWMQCVCTIEAFHKNMAITNGGGHTIHHHEYRHITDAEREANRRLDQ